MPEQQERPPRRSDAHLKRTPLQIALVLLACLGITGTIVALAIFAGSRP